MAAGVATKGPKKLRIDWVIRALLKVASPESLLFERARTVISLHGNSKGLIERSAGLKELTTATVAQDKADSAAAEEVKAVDTAEQAGPG